MPALLWPVPEIWDANRHDSFTSCWFIDGSAFTTLTKIEPTLCQCVKFTRIVLVIPFHKYQRQKESLVKRGVRYFMSQASSDPTSQMLAVCLGILWIWLFSRVQILAQVQIFIFLSSATITDYKNNCRAILELANISFSRNSRKLKSREYYPDGIPRCVAWRPLAGARQTSAWHIVFIEI